MGRRGALPPYSLGNTLSSMSLSNSCRIFDFVMNFIYSPRVSTRENLGNRRGVKERLHHPPDYPHQPVCVDDAYLVDAFRVAILVMLDECAIAWMIGINCFVCARLKLESPPPLKSMIV